MNHIVIGEPQEFSDELNRKVHEISILLQEIRSMKRERPMLKNAYYPSSRGSILNAYREGDLTFSEAVKALEGATTP